MTSSEDGRWEDEGIPSHYRVETPEDQKAARKTRSDKGQARGPRGARGTRSTSTARKDARLKAVEEKAGQLFAGTGTMLLPVAPITGTVCLNRSADFAGTIRDSAAQNAKLLVWLEKFFESSSYLGLAVIGGTLGLAVAVDRGFVNADSPATMMIQQEIQMVYGSQNQQGVPSSPQGVVG